jgi:hypothetical protein
VNLLHATMPELEFVPFDEAAVTTCLARAFKGLSLVKEAQAAFESGQLLGHARRAEALSDTTLDNALSWLVARSILDREVIHTGKRNARDTRYARGEKWADMEEIHRLLASALRDG